MSSIWDWSIVPNDNQNSDENINWLEGQPPSSVNDSARVMMQRIRQFINDISGIVTTTGGENAYQIVASSAITKYVDGFMISARAHQSSTDNATLSVNNIGAKNIYIITTTGIVRAAGRTIQADGIYDFLYSTKLNGGDGGFFLTNPAANLNVIAAGTVQAFAMRVVPSGYLYCNGQTVKRADYPDLFAAIGDVWSAGATVPADSFRIPDLRGIFLRGWGDGSGNDSNRDFASFQADDFKNHNHAGNTYDGGGGSFPFQYDTLFPPGPDGEGGWPGSKRSATGFINLPNHKHGIPPEGGSETRPKNNTVVYGIKH